VVQNWEVRPKNSCSQEQEFFYPLRKQWYIISRQAVYHQHGFAVLYLITPLGVYQKAFAMMIYKTAF